MCIYCIVINSGYLEYLSNIHHLFMKTTFKILSLSSFQLCDTMFFTIVTLLHNRTAVLTPLFLLWPVLVNQSHPIPSLGGILSTVVNSTHYSGSSLNMKINKQCQFSLSPFTEKGFTLVSFFSPFFKKTPIKTQICSMIV